MVTEKCSSQPVTPNILSTPLIVPNASVESVKSSMQMEGSSLEVARVRYENSSAADAVASVASADAEIIADYNN